MKTLGLKKQRYDYTLLYFITRLFVVDNELLLIGSKL